MAERSGAKCTVVFQCGTGESAGLAVGIAQAKPLLLVVISPLSSNKLAISCQINIETLH